MVFIGIGKFFNTPQDVLKLIEKVFQDIKEKKEIKDFKVKKELKGGIGKKLNDTIILEPNIDGVGVNINNILKFLAKKKIQQKRNLSANITNCKLTFKK